MNQNEIIGGLVANAILMTAQLANELCIQTKGEFLIPESDYLHIVKEFQVRLAKRIMPVKTSEDLKEEATKYIKELIEQSKGKEDVGDNSKASESESGIISNSQTENSKP